MPRLLPLVSAFAFAAALVGGLAPARADVEIVDLLHFQTSDPDAWEFVHRQSDSLPLTLEDVEKLTRAGVGERAILEMIRTRRLLAVADADTLVRLKTAGASDVLVAGVSAYALPPNKAIDLALQIQVATPYQVTQAPYLYVEVYNLDRKEQEAFLFADLRRLLARSWRVDVIRDRSDPLLPSQVRALRLWGHVPARHSGRLAVRVLITQRAGLNRLTDLPEAEAKRLRTFEITYPAVSLHRACELQLDLNRDPVLRDLFNVERADLRCIWD